MAVDRINEVATLTGFSYEKTHGRFAAKKYWPTTRWPYQRGGRINEVAVSTRWPY